MTIRERIEQIKKKPLKREYYIYAYRVGSETAGWGVFLSDLRECEAEGFIPKGLLDAPLNVERHYMCGGTYIVALGRKEDDKSFNHAESRLTYFK